MGTLHEDLFTFLIISRSILLRMRNVSDKICRENQNILCLVAFSFENRAIDKIVVEKYCRSGHATDDNMALAQRMLGT
jgi:hypothetical protein